MTPRDGFSTEARSPGSIDRAHQPNAFVARAQIEACTALLRKLGDRAAGGQLKPAETGSSRRKIGAVTLLYTLEYKVK